MSGSNLKTHTRIHDMAKQDHQYICYFEECDKKYKYESSLKYHCKRVHKNEQAKVIKFFNDMGNADVVSAVKT